MQNPWTYFDPLGLSRLLSAGEIQNSVSNGGYVPQQPATFADAGRALYNAGGSVWSGTSKGTINGTHFLYEISGPGQLIKFASRFSDSAAAFDKGMAESRDTLLQRVDKATSIAGVEVNANIEALGEFSAPGLPGVQQASKLNRTNKLVNASEEVSQSAQQVFRGMKEGADGFPQSGPSARTLGVREGVDIPVENGMVKPGTGGMSVAPDSPANLPVHRRPSSHGGTGKDPVYGTSTDNLGSDLSFRQDSATHGLIEPAREMPVKNFQKALSDTAEKWEKK